MKIVRVKVYETIKREHYIDIDLDCFVGPSNPLHKDEDALKEHLLNRSIEGFRDADYQGIFPVDAGCHCLLLNGEVLETSFEEESEDFFVEIEIKEMK